MRTQIPGSQILDQGVDTQDIKDNAVTDDKLSLSGIVAGSYTKVVVNDKGRVTDFETPSTLSEYGIIDAVPTQILSDSRNPNGFKNRFDSQMSFADNTRTFTIQPVASNFDVYVHGVLFHKTSAETVVIGTGEGLWFIFYNTNGVLSTSQTAWQLSEVAPVAVIYWDSSNAKHIYFAEERHSIVMDWATHEYLHTTQNTRYKNGLLISGQTTSGDGSSDNHVKFALSGGTILDEDIAITITHSATPANSFEQILTPHVVSKIFHREGATAFRRSDTLSDVPVKFGTSTIQYNLNTAGTWSLADVTNGYFVAYWVLATNNIELPVIFGVGQRQDSTLAAAQDNNTLSSLDFSSLPFNEFKFLYRLIYEVNTSYSNSVKAVLRDVLDVRGTQVTTVSAVATASHSALSGLSADDHQQYVHTTTDRIISAQHTFAPATIRPAFTLNTNAQGQLVTGLNADLLDGLHAASFQAADSDLTALAGISTTGLYTITGVGSSATRVLSAGSSKISVTNGSGVSGNPTIDVTEANLTLNNIGGTLGTTKGGTGLTGIGGANSVLGVNSGATGLEYKSFSGTGGITVTHGAGTVAIGASLNLDALTDVVITTPVNGHTLAYNGTNWVNTAVAASSATGTLSSWTLVSGNRYYSDFAHNLGTNNVVITLYDTSNNTVVTADEITLTNTNTVRVQVIGNSRTLRIVVVANGYTVNTGTQSAGTITTAKDSVNVSTAASRLNFTGQAVGVVDAGSGTTTVTIGSRFTFFAHAFDTPNNADWAISTLAPTVPDPSFASLSVRQFSNTTEQGVGFLLSIPSGTTTATFKIRGRSAAGQASAQNYQPRLYSRLIPNNAAMGAWSAASNLTSQSVPANANYQYFTITASISSLGLVAGNTYQIEFTRNTGVASNLAANFLLAELTVELA